MRRWLTVAACLLATVGRLAAQGDPNRTARPERPTVATHAFAVAPGYLEIELGGQLDRYRGAVGGGSVPVELKVGIVPRMQLTVLDSYVVPPGGSSGPGDVSMGLKIRLNDTTARTGVLAFLPSIKFPSGNAVRGTGTGTTDLSLLGILSRPLGPLSMDLNAGVTFRTGDGSVSPRSASVWTASLGGPLGRGSMGWALEIFGFPGTSGPAGSAPSVSVLAGPTIQLAPTLVLDAGIVAPLQGDAPRSLYAGAVYNVGRLWGGMRHRACAALC